MILFCFPYAGGSSVIYKDWQSFLGESIKVKPFELPGRGKRFSESTCNSLDEIVEDIIGNICIDLQENSYSLFGHSMGATIVIKLLEEINKRAMPLPKHIFLSGSKPLHLKDESVNDHLLPDNEFIDVLRDYGGTPDEFFDNQELIDFFLPRLRSDFKLASFQIEHESLIESYNTDITVLYGDSDENTKIHEVYEWGKYTEKKLNVHCIKGDHFFIDKNPSDVLSVVKKQLSQKILN